MMCTPTQCRYLTLVSHFVASMAPRGTLRKVSAESAKVLGRSPAALAGKNFSRFLPADERPRLARVLQRCKTERAVWEEIDLESAGGDRIPILCCFQRLLAPADPEAILVTGLKIESLKTGGEIRTAALLGQLAFRCHGPAHRLMMAVEAVLAEHPKCRPAKRCRNELDVLLELLSQTAAWPGDDAAPGAVDVVRVLEAALGLMDGDPAYEGLATSLRAECSPIWAAAHPVGVVFVALHLARNAREAAARVKRPQLVIDVYLGKDEVVLEFKDNGSGLGRRPRNRATSSCSKKSSQDGHHTGLGLLTCSELVRFMGGRLRVQSRPAKSAAVVVTLPAAPPPA